MSTALEVIPGVQQAIAWLSNKMQEFEATGPRLNGQLRVAGELAAIAQAQGRPQEYQQLLDQITRLGKLAAEWQGTRNKLAPVRDWLRANGFALPVIPLVVGAAAVAAIASVAYVIKEASVEQGRLDLVAKGLISPAQYAEIQNNAAKRPLFNFDFGKLVPVAAVGLGAYLLLGWVKGRGRGSPTWT